MPRADCEERNTSSSEYAKELIMKAQSLSMTISKQSKLSKQKLAIRRARNDFNGMILGDKQHQERIQQLTKELNKQRKELLEVVLNQDSHILITMLKDFKISKV